MINKSPPTDRKVLQAIYNRYYDAYCDLNTKGNSDSTNYIPIDCTLIAKDLKTDPNIIFGQLYFHLDKKYRYKQDGGNNVHLFAKVIGDDINAINFPLLSSVLAEMQESNYRFLLPIFISLFALGISIYAAN